MWIAPALQVSPFPQLKQLAGPFAVTLPIGSIRL